MTTFYPDYEVTYDELFAACKRIKVHPDIVLVLEIKEQIDAIMSRIGEDEK